MEDMLSVRRDWVNEQKVTQGKIPDDIKPFYDRFNTENVLSPEEEAAKKAAEDEERNRKKKKDLKVKKAKGKKGKKDDDDEK